jgi:hypothetical protein
MGDCLKTYGKKDLNSLTNLRIENFCASLGQHKSKKAFLALPIVVQCMFLHHGHQILSDPKKHSKKSYQQAFNLFKIFQGEGGKDVETYKKYRKFVLSTPKESSSVEESEEEEGSAPPSDERPPPKEVKKPKPAPPKPSESSESSESSDDDKPIAKPGKATKASKAKKPSIPTRTPKRTTPAKRAEGSKRTKKTYDEEYQKFEEPPDDTDPLYIFYTSLYEQKPKSRLAITWLTEHGVYDGDDRKTLVEKYKKLAEKGELIK